MITVEFLGPIGLNPLHKEATNLQEIAEHLQTLEPLRDWLSSSAVAVNDVIIKNLNHPLKNGDKVSLLPPVCGG